MSDYKMAAIRAALDCLDETHGTYHDGLWHDDGECLICDTRRLLRSAINQNWLEECDPMHDHKCRPIAVVRNLGPGREWWMGELLEPIPGHPEELWCMHIKTPYKSVVWGLNGGDMEAYAVLAQIAFHEAHPDTKGPINPNWLDSMEQKYRHDARALRDGSGREEEG